MGYIGNAPAAGSVTGDNIVDGTIDTADIKNGAVTAAKLGSGAAVSNIGYTPANQTQVQYDLSSTESEIYVQEPPFLALHASGQTASDWKTLATWVAEKSGTVRIKFSAYITSGTNYWAFRARRNSSEVLKSGYFSTDLDSGQTASVHNYRRFNITLTGLSAGDVITLELISANGAGTPVAGANQTLYVREFRVYSSKVPIERGKSIYSNLPVGFTTFDSDFDAMEGYAPVLFAGFDYKLIGYFPFRDGARYLDIKTNISGNNIMHQFMAHGYLYGHGNIFAMRGGYVYEGDVINEPNTSMTGANQIVDIYLASDGALCVKLDKTSSSYTEGRVAVYFHAHDKAVQNSIFVTRYRQNNVSGAVY
jgi:hypothetical protein